MEIKVKDKYWLILDDCLEGMKKIPNEKCDSLITDPPAGISFMGKSWDNDKGGRDFWIEWMSNIMKEAMRCLKPGAHGLVWALPRTSHWTATALENAGFEVRDIVTHLFGTGFPKSLNISKAIEKEAGIKPLEIKPASGVGFINNTSDYNTCNNQLIMPPISLDSAKQYDGWGTALKPASEHWVLIRKPLSEKTIAKNVLKYGTGGINIDECRIENENKEVRLTNQNQTIYGGNSLLESKTIQTTSRDGNPQGRFPANLVLDEIAAEMLDDQSGILKSGGGDKGNKDTNGIFGNGKSFSSNCEPSTGGASRFFKVFKEELLCGQENTKDVDMFVGKSLVNKKDNSNIDGYGLNNMEIFRMGTISITEMETHSIMIFPILNVLKNINIGTCIIKSDKIIKSLTELNIESVKIVSNIESLITLKNGEKELIKGIVSIVLDKNSEIGEIKIENITTPIIENIDKNNRFFYVAKASKSDKNAGCEGLEKGFGKRNFNEGMQYKLQVDGTKTSIEQLPQANTHPTVKSTKLMEYLIKLITPENGIVLDPFMGSGSTGVACQALNKKFIGIEKEEEYFNIAKTRLEFNKENK